MVPQLIIQTCPETLKGWNIDQERAAWFQFLANLLYRDRVVLDVLKNVQRENE